MYHYRVVGDTLTPIGISMSRYGKPIDLTGQTVNFKMVDNLGNVVVAETNTNVAVQPGYSFAVLGDWIISNSHGVSDGDELTLNTSGTLPTGLAAGVRYFAIQCETNRFKLALSVDGLPVSLSSCGSGTMNYVITGTVQYYFQTGDVAVAGIFWGYFVLVQGGQRETFPSQYRNTRIPSNFIQIIIGTAD